MTKTPDMPTLEEAQSAFDAKPDLSTADTYVAVLAQHDRAGELDGSTLVDGLARVFNGLQRARKRLH